MTNHSIEKIIDRVRKLLALSEGAGSEHEAAVAAARATSLIVQYQLDEAALRVDAPELPPEPIEQSARLEPDQPEIGRKRVAWREAIALAVARDLGVKMYWWNYKVNGRKYRDVRGYGRESAIQAWRYTCQYLWRTVDELAEAEDVPYLQSARSFRNAYRVGCAQRIAERLYALRKERERAPAPTPDADGDRRTQALVLVQRDQQEVEQGYAAYSKDWKGTAPVIGTTSNYSGYERGRQAGDRVSLGGGRGALPAGQGRLKS